MTCLLKLFTENRFKKNSLKKSYFNNFFPDLIFMAMKILSWNENVSHFKKLSKDDVTSILLTDCGPFGWTLKIEKEKELPYGHYFNGLTVDCCFSALIIFHKFNHTEKKKKSL